MKTIFLFLILCSFSAESQEFFCDSVEVFIEKDSISWKSLRKASHLTSLTIEMKDKKVFFEEEKDLIHEFEVKGLKVSEEGMILWLTEGENIMLLTIPSNLKLIRLFYRNTECLAIKKEFRIKKIYTN